MFNKRTPFSTLQVLLVISLVSQIHRISHKLSFESRQLYILKEFSFETFAEHSKPGSTRGGPSWFPAGQRRQGWQEEPVRPGGAGRGRPEGRPVHQGHRWQQAHSHCWAGMPLARMIENTMITVFPQGAVPARASKEGAGGCEAERSPPQDCLQLQESAWQDLLCKCKCHLC